LQIDPTAEEDIDIDKPANVLWDHAALGPENATLIQAMKRPAFWCQWFTFCVGGGAGLVLINNVAQINTARGGDPKLKDVIRTNVSGDPGSVAKTILREISVRAQVFVTLISIFNCAGRMFWGLASDFGLNRYGISRPFFFGIVVAIMCVVQVLLLVFDSEPPRYRCHLSCILLKTAAISCCRQACGCSTSQPSSAAARTAL